MLPLQVYYSNLVCDFKLQFVTNHQCSVSKNRYATSRKTSKPQLACCWWEKSNYFQAGRADRAAMFDLLIVGLLGMATMLPHCCFPISPTVVQLRMMGMPIILQVVEQRKRRKVKSEGGVWHSQPNSCSEEQKNEKKELQNRISGLGGKFTFSRFSGFQARHTRDVRLAEL